MSYKNIFIDSDILLDLLLKRDTFFSYARQLFIEGLSGEIKVNTSALIIANIHYILEKHIGKESARESIAIIVKDVNVLPFEVSAVKAAVKSDFADFEDAIQHFIAAKFKCDAIITRNIKDYKQATIPVLTAEQFLRTL